MRPLEKKILSDFGIEKFIVCTDAGLSSTPNRIFNNTANRRFVTAQSIKKLKGFLKDFSLADEGWHLVGSRKTYKLSELDEQDYYDKTFYKDRWIKEDGIEQHLVVTFSFKYRDYQRKVRNRQLERAAKLANNPSALNRSRQNDPKRFVRQDHCTSDGEVADRMIVSIDEGMVREEEQYDGFYAVCTNLLR